MKRPVLRLGQPVQSCTRLLGLGIGRHGAGSGGLAGKIGMIEGSPDLSPGDRVSMFSYGSGSCSEFYAGLVGKDARAVAAGASLGRLLDERHPLTVRDYEDVERERTCWLDQGDFEPSLDGFGGWYDRHYRGKGKLVFRGIKEHYRCYGWS